MNIMKCILVVDDDIVLTSDKGIIAAGHISIYKSQIWKSDHFSVITVMSGLSCRDWINSSFRVESALNFSSQIARVANHPDSTDLWGAGGSSDLNCCTVQFDLTLLHSSFFPCIHCAMNNTSHTTSAVIQPGSRPVNHCPHLLFVQWFICSGPVPCIYGCFPTNLSFACGNRSISCSVQIVKSMKKQGQKNAGAKQMWSVQLCRLV